MASIGGGGGKRDVNVDVNIVPFIDLMSVLITFLLITAVWSQVSMIQIGSSIYAKKNSDTTPEPPPPLADIVLRVDVKESGFRVVVGKDMTSIPKVAGEYNYPQLVTSLKSVKTKFPEKVDGYITIDDEVQYENLISTMDRMIASGFPSVNISQGGSE